MPARARPEGSRPSPGRRGARRPPRGRRRPVRSPAPGRSPRPVAGFRTGVVAPSTASTSSPSMKFRSGAVAVVLMRPNVSPPRLPARTTGTERERHLDQRRHLLRRAHRHRLLRASRWPASPPPSWARPPPRPPSSAPACTPEQVEHVVFGNVIHTETADMYMARVVGMKAGHPEGDAGVHRQPPVRHRACRRSSRPARRSRPATSSRRWPAAPSR